ncbi:MAG: class I SAM-dependent methyltransferase [Longimicrobiales bacterium]
MDADVFRVHAEVERRHWWFAARRDILRAVLEHYLPADGSHTVTDIGCGVGANAAAFHPGYRWIGYDPSVDAVAFARSAHPDVSFHVGSAAEAADTLARTDAALLTDVIEHVPDDRALLDAVVAPMKSGAYVLITVPAGMELWSPHDVALGHYRRYDVPSLTAAWAGIPVEPVFVSHFNSRLYLPVRAVRILTSMLRHSAGASGTDLGVPPGPVNAALERFFRGETARLVSAARRGRPAYSRGVSILALLRRTGTDRQ